MKKRAIQTVQMLAIVAAVVFFDACGGGTKSSPPPPAAVTASFSANPTSITAGQPTTLTWSTTNATSVSIDNGIGTVATPPITVHPTGTTTYTLTATGAGGSVTRTATVTVTPVSNPVTVTSFTANPTTVTAGQDTTLAWATQNATSVSIDNGVGTNLAPSGHQTVAVAATTTYTLTATGPGGTATATVSVTANAVPTDITALNHIVFMLQENRSFDQYFGKLNDYRVKNGVSPDVDGLPANASNPTADSPPTGVVQSFHMRSQCVDNTSPSWNEAHVQRNRNHPNCTAASCFDPTMDGFVLTAADYAINNLLLDVTGIRAMGYYTEDDMPYYYFMATQFATSNRWFSPLLARTQPNKLYEYAATSAGFIRAPDQTLPNRTIFHQLEDAGISWKIYLSDPNANFFTVFQPFASQHQDKMVPVQQYFDDVKNGTLPSVAFIETVAGLDEHPGGQANGDPNPNAGIQMQVGIHYVSTLINALMQSPSWKDSVFILAFDEGGGIFDHVPPQKTVAPDDTPPMYRPAPLQDVQGDFTLTGFRTPFFLVSPFAKKHYVSNTPMDHTAVLKFIQLRFLKDASGNVPSLTRRDAAQPSMEEFFDFVNPPWMTPPLPSEIPTQPTNMLCDRTQLR